MTCDFGALLGWSCRSPWGGIQWAERIQIFLSFFFPTFSLPLFPGDVGKKNGAWDSFGIHILSISWRECPQSSYFSINACIFLVWRCEEDLKKTNIWVFVWPLFRSHKYADAALRWDGGILSRLKLQYLVSKKDAWEVMYVLCNFLSRPVSDQEWGLWDSR